MSWVYLAAIIACLLIAFMCIQRQRREWLAADISRRADEQADWGDEDLKLRGSS